MKRLRAKNAYDEQLLFGYLLTMAVGLIMVYSSSSIMAESRFGSQFYFLRQQFVWSLLSVGAIWLCCRIDLKRLAVYAVPGLLVTILMLVLVFLMPARNGSHRWLFLGPLTVQPSELFKFLLILVLSFSLANPKRNLANLRQVIFPYVPFIGLGVGLILLEPDLGTCIVIVITVVGMFFLAGAKIKHLLVPSLSAASGVALLVLVFGYKKARVLDYMGAILDPLQGSYHVKQAALTIGSGGLVGMGLGDGRQKLFFLPYPHTDFIFASMAEEIGFIGLLAVVGLLAFLLWRGCRIAMAQPDRFGFLLAAGMTWSLFVNIIINLGVVTALLPVTGLALPFFSYGGSSLLVSSAAIGVLMNLSRRAVR